VINSKFEYILCAAIWFDDGKVHVHQPKNIESGYVICGRRHHNCFATSMLLKKKPNMIDIVQGFVSSHDKFYDRQEAYKIAKENGQLQFDDDNGKTLISEDLY